MRFAVRRHRSVLVALALGAATLPVLAPSPAYVAAATDDAAVPTYEKAQALFRARKYPEAIAMLDVFVVAHPRDARAFVLRGDAKANGDDNAAALRDYNTAIGIDPEYQYAYVTRCETRLQLNDSAGALADCNVAIRMDAADALAYQDRADVFFDRGAYDSALADYDKAVELGRSSAYLFAARCDANRLVGNRERAAADCEKSLTIDPQGRRGLWARGRLSIVGGRYTDAVTDLTAYIEQKPKMSDTGYYFRGVAYNRLQRYQLALDDLQLYVQRAPRDADGYAERGIARAGLGEKAGALADFDVAQRAYRTEGDSAAAARVAGMAAAVRAGRQLTP